MVKQKSFKKLRDALYIAEIDQNQLAEILKVSFPHVNRLLGAKTQWRLTEMYATLEAINERNPAANIDIQKSLGEFFPEDDYLKLLSCLNR